MIANLENKFMESDLSKEADIVLTHGVAVSTY